MTAAQGPSAQGPSAQGPSAQGPSAQGQPARGPSARGPSARGPSGDPGYELVDSGDGRKLERFGGIRVDRPCPQALWRPAGSPLWDSADGRYVRSSSGGGAWERSAFPESWTMAMAERVFLVKPTGFGHMGLFPEQLGNWSWIAERVGVARERLGRAPQVLNLFAYTGASTLAAAAAGAQVCHVDAARGIVGWARENARLSGLPDDRVRWIVEDVQRFVVREAKRGRRYEGIVLDPPTYGRGKKGEVWQIERDLVGLLEACAGLLSPDAELFLLSAHTPGVSPACLENLLQSALAATDPSGAIERGEMIIHGEGMTLPSGEFARWSRAGAAR